MFRFSLLTLMLVACSDKGGDSSGTTPTTAPTDDTATTGADDTGTTPADDTGTTPTGPSFDDFNAVLIANCNGCHIGGGGSGGLKLDDARAATMGVAAGGGGTLVVCGDSSNSVLYQKTGPTPPYGGTMPQGSGPLDEANRDIIKGWIDAGCP